ncbi:MAG: PilZ domain-containing protein [Proteobacteria bacterium]|nr:PilZ domain-containing protein [Pseudomonadota bacterium]MBU1612336.1 PilZ domain-containing protein [Pseudomonadota bacterium]
MERLSLPDTGDADKHVRLDASKPKKIFSFDFLKSIPKNLDVALSSKETRDEEKAARKALQERLKQEKKEQESQADPFGFSINLEDTKHDEVHQSIAITYPGLAAVCLELKKAVRVKDISTTGVGLRFESPRVKGGTLLTLTLGTKQGKILSGVRAKVMRHEKGIIGAKFVELTRQQENTLSKLVLEGQKLQGRMRKKRTLPKEIEDLKV